MTNLESKTKKVYIIAPLHECVDIGNTVFVGKAIYSNKESAEIGMKLIQDFYSNENHYENDKHFEVIEIEVI